MRTPERTLDQRLAALDKANTVRTYRSNVKRDLKAGRKSIAELVDDPMCDTMKVWDALIAVPWHGRTKVNRTLTRLQISPSKTLGGLSDRQRYELLRTIA